MSARGQRSLRFSAVALALLASAALFNETRNYGLVGYDTYPLIISSRVESFADFTGLFSERLMDGRYPSPMYRPLTSATFALDYAVWGLDARGYHATNALAFAAIALALAALGAQLGRESSARPTPPGAEWLVLVLPALFVLHPSFYEIAPVPARRADLLCAALMVAAVAASLGGRRLAAAAAAGAAIAAKESGFAAPVLVVVTAWLFAARSSGFWANVVEALRESAPTIAVAATMLGLRLAVLGGIGGHQEELALLGALETVPRIALDLVLGVALVPIARSDVAWAALIAGLGFVAVGFGKLPKGEAAAELRVIAFGLIWVGILSLTYASAGWVGAWYYMIPAVGIEIVFATLLCASSARALDARHSQASRLLSAASAVALTAVIAWQGSYSPAFHRYSEWERATQVARDFETRLAAQIERSVPGEILEAPPLPMWVAPYEGIPGVQGAAVFSDYSVQAWAELVFPERQIRVSGIEGGVLPLEYAETSTSAHARGDLRVRLSRRLLGY